MAADFPFFRGIYNPSFSGLAGPKSCSGDPLKLLNRITPVPAVVVTVVEQTPDLSVFTIYGEGAVEVHGVGEAAGAVAGFVVEKSPYFFVSVR